MTMNHKKYDSARGFGGSWNKSGRNVPSTQHKRDDLRRNFNSRKPKVEKYNKSRHSSFNHAHQSRKCSKSINNIRNKIVPSSKSKHSGRGDKNCANYRKDESCNSKAGGISVSTDSPPRTQRKCESDMAISDNNTGTSCILDNNLLQTELKNDKLIEYPKDYIPKSYEEYLSKRRDRKHRRLRLHQLSDCSSSLSNDIHDLSDEESLDMTTLSIKSRSPINSKTSSEISSPCSSPYGSEPSSFEIPPEFVSCLSPHISPRFYNRTPSPIFVKRGNSSPSISESSSEEEHFSDHEFQSYLDLQDQCNWTPPHIREDIIPPHRFYALPDLKISQQPVRWEDTFIPHYAKGSSESSNVYNPNNIVVSEHERISPHQPKSVSLGGIRPLPCLLRKPTSPPTEYQNNYKNNHLSQRRSPHPVIYSPEVIHSSEMEICSPGSPIVLEIPKPNRGLICNDPLFPSLPSPPHHFPPSPPLPPPSPPPPPPSPPPPPPPPPSSPPFLPQPHLRLEVSRSTQQTNFTSVEYTKVDSPPSPKSSPDLKLKGDSSPPTPELSPQSDFTVTKSPCKQEDINLISQADETSFRTPSVLLPSDSSLNKVETFLESFDNDIQNNDEHNKLDCDEILPFPFHQYHSFLNNPSKVFQSVIQSFQTSPQNKRQDESSESDCGEFLPQFNQFNSFLNNPQQIFQTADQLLQSPQNITRDENNDPSQFLLPVNQYQSFLNTTQVFQNAHQLLQSSEQNKQQDISENPPNLSKSLSDEEWQDSDLNDKPKTNEASISVTPCTNTWQHIYLNNEAKIEQNSILASLRLSSESEYKNLQNYNKTLYDNEWQENNFPSCETQVSNNSSSSCEWQDSDIKTTSIQNVQTNSKCTKFVSQSKDNYDRLFSTPKSNNNMTVDDYITCLKLTPHLR